jgi:serine O-acetyltransferase
MLENFRADLKHFASLGDPGESTSGVFRRMVLTQGVWAVAVYRFGRWVHTDAPRAVALPLKLPYLVATKLIEMATGIRLPARAEIGPGLYIGHFGGIIVHADTVMGENCSLSHGVTVGTRGGGRHEVPRIGDRVYIGAGAKVLGKVTIGHDARVGANAVVLDDVPPGATAVGVPARILSPGEGLKSVG